MWIILSIWCSDALHIVCTFRQDFGKIYLNTLIACEILQILPFFRFMKSYIIKLNEKLLYLPAQNLLETNASFLII